jgi:hypothetical protein
MADEATNAQPLSRRELEEKIVARAWTDDDFRRKFVVDPKGQFEEHLASKLPEALTITVHEETSDSLHFVIPAKPKANLDELSDEDLEKVAGGIDVIYTVTVAVVTIGALIGGGVSASVGVKAGWGK